MQNINVNKSTYRGFCKSKYFGDGSKFFDATKELLFMLNYLRDVSKANDLFFNTSTLFKRLGHIQTDLTTFSYERTYDYLSIIDSFLIDSQAIYSMIEAHEILSHRHRELGFKTLIFPVDPNHPESVIRQKEMWSHNEFDQNNEIDRITLLGSTIFYSNKAAKFIESVEEKLYDSMGINLHNSIAKLSMVDSVFNLPATAKYLNALNGDDEIDLDTYANDICISISEEISKGKLNPGMHILAKNPDLLQQLIHLRISKNVLYNIKNLCIMQEIELCNRWNENNPDHPIDYFINPEEAGIAFNLPYMNMSIYSHMPPQLYKRVQNDLQSQGLWQKVTTIPDNAIFAPNIMLRPLIDDAQVKWLQDALQTEGLQDNKYLKFLGERIDRDRDF